MVGIFHFSIKARDIVIAALCGAVNDVLQIISTFFTPIPGISVFYPPSGFGSATGVWFGFWGWIGAVLGTLFAAPYWGYSLPVALLFAFLTPWEVLIPALIWRSLKLDASLKGAKAYAVYIGIVAIFGTFLDAVFGMFVSIFAGYYTTDFAFKVAIWPWWLADAVAALVLGIVLLKALTPYIKKTGLYYDGFFARRTTLDTGSPMVGGPVTRTTNTSEDKPTTP
jgi:hypothetical protein